MGFMESIMLKLEFKLIIGLVFIFNYIFWIDINLILIDAIKLEFALSFGKNYCNCRFYSIEIFFFLFNIQFS
jgi:hypothetical protein